MSIVKFEVVMVLKLLLSMAKNHNKTIAILTTATIMHRISANEKVQIGTLKALGFRDSKILMHYTSYGLFLGVLGSVAGIGMGFLVGRFIMNPDGMMGSYLDIPTWNLYMPSFCWIVLVIVIAFMFVMY